MCLLVFRWDCDILWVWLVYLVDVVSLIVVDVCLVGWYSWWCIGWLLDLYDLLWGVFDRLGWCYYVGEKDYGVMFGLGIWDDDLLVWLVVWDFGVWFLVVWVGVRKFVVLLGMY